MTKVVSKQVRAYAKVNLALAVGPTIPEGQPKAGYHPIASWMHAVDLFDEIEITPAMESSYDIAWSDGTSIDWEVSNDLCVRSHQAIELVMGQALPIRLRLRKSIPAGGGLGGGSADAGAVLLALRDVFKLELSDQQLVAIGYRLGTDVPFFIDPLAWSIGLPPRPALVSGVGDRIERTERLDDVITLYCPPFGCATAAVYQRFDQNPTSECDEQRVRDLVGSGGMTQAGLFNDLAAAAESVEPRLSGIRRGLESSLAQPVHVSGSGSTLFASGHTDPGVCAEVRVISTRLI